jgi:hypothetical protein
MAGWKTWVIYRSEDTTIVGCFPNRSLCREYLKFKKEQYFFETGSMEDAEKEWGEENFIIDYSLTLDRVTVFSNYSIKCEAWTHD